MESIELCDRYFLECFINVKELKANDVHACYMHVELLIEEVIEVDEVNDFCEATPNLEDCKFYRL